MLSAKMSRVHGMKNEKWNTKDKIQQYRGILKLHVRDRKLQATNGEILKRKITRNLKELNSDIRKYREILNEVLFGDKRLTRTVLQTEKDFRIVLQDAQPMEAWDVVFQDYNLKRKQYSKFLHQKEKARKEICRLKFEYEKLSEGLLLVNSLTESEEKQEHRQQRLMARYQVALSKQNAAKSIADTYLQLIDILKKDSMYFDGVLNALRIDQREQCTIIHKTTLMGQLVCENLDDIRIKYKKMVQDVWINMKERERTLEITKRKVEDVWEYAKSLVRIDSEQNLIRRKPDKGMNIDIRLQNQIKNLENIFDKMKDQLLVRSYEELFTRLETQMKQRSRLKKLYNRTIKERDTVLNRKNHAEMILKKLEHGMLSTTTKYRTDKKAMLDKIAEEKKREEELTQNIETEGQLLLDIRAALQNMSSMLVCIKAPRSVKGKEKKGKKGKKTAQEEEEDKEKTEEEEEEEEAKKKGKKDKKCRDIVEEDALAVLTQVTRKAISLSGMTNIAFDRLKERKAKDAYETYVADYQSYLKYGGEDEEQAMYFEHEAVDTGVITRSEIKKKSKQIVEAHTKEDDD